MRCPDCDSDQIIKNGFNALDKQIYRCKACGRQFVLDPDKGPISKETKDLIDRLLLERIALAGIARVVGVSESWLQRYVNKKYAEVPREVQVKRDYSGSLIVECDEMWSFVGKRSNKQWLWLALDRESRCIIGAVVGDRSEASAQGLWDSLPTDYRECGFFYTDFWAAYGAIFPPDAHDAVGKESGKTNHIERLNCTIRQRISRLVRKALSFSKIIDNHIGAIWYFIHHYNDSLNIDQDLASEIS